MVHACKTKDCSNRVSDTEWQMRREGCYCTKCIDKMRPQYQFNWPRILAGVDAKMKNFTVFGPDWDPTKLYEVAYIEANL